MFTISEHYIKNSEKRIFFLQSELCIMSQAYLQSVNELCVISEFLVNKDEYQTIIIIA